MLITEDVGPVRRARRSVSRKSVPASMRLSRLITRCRCGRSSIIIDPRPSAAAGVP